MMKELEDVSELMHHIQLRLPVKAAAQTSVLSKSWLHAWSTIPTLRFHVGKKKQGRNQLDLVDRTLKRYHRDNIPIERFDLKIDIENRKSASLAANCLRTLATRTSLKELSLAIDLFEVSFNLPDEILLAGENITKIRVAAKCGPHSVFMKSMSLSQSRSLSLLRDLHLEGVRISQQVLDHILSSCSFLVTIKLKCCSRDLKAIKVKNLRYLYKLNILTIDEGSTALEINNVPSLGSFSCNLSHGSRHLQSFINKHSISLGSSLTQLSLGGLGLITDDTSLDIIKPGQLPFLKSLTLDMEYWTLGRFHLTCASINKFSLFSCPQMLTNVEINAAKLFFFCFHGNTMPSLLFPSSITLLRKTTFRLNPKMPFDVSFFLKMREALTLTSKCYIHITTSNVPQLDIVEELRTRLSFPPATNVQRLSFQTCSHECMWDLYPFLDAFFEVCHPTYVYAKPDMIFRQKNHFCNIMLREVLVLEKTTTVYWTRYLKHVQIRCHEKWETLTNSHASYLDGLTRGCVKFKLNWS